MKRVFFINSQKFNPINPLFAGEQKCESGYGYGPAIRKYYLLHFVVSGNGTFRNKHGEFFLGENDCFIIRPNELTYYEADKDDPWHYIWLAFDDSYLIPDSLKQGGTVKNSSLRDFFLSILNVESISTNKGAFMCGKIFELFQLLQDRIQSNSYIEKSILLMQSNISTTVSISEIADRLHLDRTYFSTVFKQETGQSPQEYYLSLRLNQAKILIKDYNLNITQASQATGFESIANFSRMYKKHLGYSPSELFKK